MATIDPTKTTIPADMLQVQNRIETPSLNLSDPTPALQGVFSTLPQEQRQLEVDQAGQRTGAANLSSLVQSLTGMGADQAALEEKAGIGAIQKDVTDLTNQLNLLKAESQTIPLQTQQEYQGRLSTQAGVGAIETGKLRENAIKALTTSALLQAKQGSLLTAQNQVDRAIQLKYEPIKAQIEATRQQLEINDKYFITPAEKKLAEKQKIALAERERMLEEKKTTEKAISEIGVTLGRYGVDQRTISDVLSSKNINEAILKAGSKLQDPKAKMELESIRLDQLIKGAELQKIQRATALLGQPTAAEKKAQVEALKNAKAAVPVLEDKMLLMEGILSSNAIDSVVGPTFLSRAGGDIKGIAGRVAVGAAVGAAAGAPVAGVGAIPGAVIGGVALGSQGLADVFGSRQDLISSVNQLTDKAFLDELLSLKERGGTLGQVTEKEGQALRSAASKIGTWEIKDSNGKVIGYNASEKDFKKEIERIKQSTNRILTELRGSQYSADEQKLLDETFNSPLNDNASSYFQ